MKKISTIILICILVLVLGACSSDKIKEEKYKIDALYYYGGTSDKTEVSYEIIISGAEKDIENIDSSKVLINKDYLESVLENGPHDSNKELDEELYIKLTGRFLLDTSRDNKQEVDKNKLILSVELIDKDNNETILNLNK